MPPLENTLLFLAASLVLLVTPGPAVLYIVARSLGQGSKAGVISSLGLSVGGVCHVAAATLGLSYLIASSLTLFHGIKLAGAVYLIYLGIRTLKQSETTPAKVSSSSMSSRRIFRQGILVNVLNPKPALFFVAFLPQFVDPSLGAVWAQTLFLGCLFLLLGLVTDIAYALLAGSTTSLLDRKPGFWRHQKRFSGLTYIALGIYTAISGGPVRHRVT